MTTAWRNLAPIRLILCLVPVFLLGCGGGSNVEMGSAPSSPSMADHSTVTFVRGVVTAAQPDSDTIHVGDDEVVITSAAMSENGVPLADAKPKIGQTVNLSVTRDSSGARFVAQAIDIALVAKGPVEALNAAASTFTLLGQTVSYSTTTVFANFPIGTALATGSMVSVSGSVTGSGQITATRVEYLGAAYSAASGIQIAGVVQNLNTVARTFTMGSLTVNYSLAPTTQVLTNGGMVIAGATALALSGTLNANEISVIGGGGGGQPVGSVIDTTIAIRGPIEQVNALGGTFTVMGQTVSYNTTTQFPSTQANTLVVGYVVRVTATPNAVGGQMTATRVELVGTTYTPAAGRCRPPAPFRTSTPMPAPLRWAP